MKNKIISFIFVLYLVIFSLLHIFISDKDISITERRSLVKFPEFKFSSEYISSLDKYLLDHFPFRDDFRSFKALFNYKVLNTYDNNKIYLKDNYIFKSNYPTNEKNIDNFIIKTLKVSENFKNNNVYVMIIPDKNYYLESDNFLHLDYEYIFNRVNDLGFNNIDIKDELSLDKYYETDTHWRQEKINSVVSKYLKSVGIKEENINYKINSYDKFYGVYYGESAINRNAEVINYLTCDNFDNITVSYLENKNLNEVYNLDKLKSLDSYEVFLDGASSFIEINNNNSFTDRELIVFRDSFGSSFIPLIASYYKKITVIDNRYINSNYFKDMVEFDNQDILFLYSTLIINESSTLKG